MKRERGTDKATERGTVELGRKRTELFPRNRKKKATSREGEAQPYKIPKNQLHRIEQDFIGKKKEVRQGREGKNAVRPQRLVEGRKSPGKGTPKNALAEGLLAKKGNSL